jgi:lysine-N-methylase
MKIRVPSYYKDFQCIASACEDTCCAGWDVVIDSQTYKTYQDMEGAFGDRLRSKLVADQDGDNIFVLDGDRCPFLNKDLLCDIHKDLGEEYLCHTCKQYPRYREDFFDLKEMGISLSCPEAARIILDQTKGMTFELSADSQVGNPDEADEQELLEEFFRCRDAIIHILEMTNLSLGVRAGIVLSFVQELQDRLDFAELEALAQVRQKYEKPSFIRELTQDLDAFKANEDLKYNNVHAYFKTYASLEHINPNDPLDLEYGLSMFWNTQADKAFYFQKHKAFNQYYKEKMHVFQNILTYFVYRYFMKSFYDYDMSSKIKVAMMSTIMIKELAIIRWIKKGEFSQADMVDISHSYSKDVEHLEKNIETLEIIFETQEEYNMDKIINTLMNEYMIN